LVSDAVSIPVIAHGGAKSPENAVQAIREANADAITLASILHYSVMQSFSNHPDDYMQEGNISFLNGGKTPKNIMPSSLKEIRTALINAKIQTRV
jgi:cyclase